VRAKRRGVTVVRQRHDWDCGISAVAMLLGKPYGDVAAVTRELVDPRKIRQRGLVIGEVQDIAARFGVCLDRVYRRKGNAHLNGRTGILGMNGGEMDKAGHWVILKSGPCGRFIVDPDGGESWDVDDYIRKHRARPATLLVEA
jgi:hypothetical protein